MHLGNGLQTSDTSSSLLLLCRKCGSHYSDMKALLPRSFVWLLQLFSFLLDVEPHCLYEEVLSLERRLFSSKTPRDRVRIRKRTRTSTGTPQRSEEMDGDS